MNKETVTVNKVPEGLPGGQFVYSAVGEETVYYADNNVVRLYGCDSYADFIAFVGNSFRNMIHPEDLREAEELIHDQSFALGHRHDYLRYRILTKQGEVRYVEDFGHLTYDAAGRPFYYVFIQPYEEEGEERSAYLRQLKEADKLREMNRTMASLLDNMPGMTFTKDAKTGRYLACNQAFAKYACKASPEEVLGHTDAELFDPKTAAHFVQDDQTALGMDKAYILFEDVPDAQGRRRQLQTTKLKYTDSQGRLCLQGMCQDVTDMIRIQRESRYAQEAYAEAQTNLTIYNHLAHALARGYTDLYYVNMDTDELIEFHTDDQRGVLSEARRGQDFFEGCERDAKLFVHPEDQEKFVKAMNREYLREVLKRDKVFEMTYRRILGDRTFYVQMKLSRVENDSKHIVIAVSDIDELMRQRRQEERIREERIVYARLHALTGNFIVVYVVDPVTDKYREFSATEFYTTSFAQKKAGEDFFGTVRSNAQDFNHPEDMKRFLRCFTKRNVMQEVRKNGIFTLGYRILMDGRPIHIQMKAAMVEEEEGPRLIVGLNDIDAQVRQEEELERRLSQAQNEVNIDALTGVKNKHAYLITETGMDRQIAEGRQSPFAIVMLDVNDLKLVNDTAGHQAGDQYLRDACHLICDVFKHSPVFRVGGDEFAVVAQGRDYAAIRELTGKIHDHNVKAIKQGGIVIACGVAHYAEDSCVATVFERADQHMYENKNDLKEMKKDTPAQ